VRNKIKEKSMLSERKKAVLILTLEVIAVSIEILLLLYLIFPRGGFSKFLFDIGLTRWGWIPVFVLTASAIIGALFCKPRNRFFQIFVISVSIIVLIFASLWLFFIFIAINLKP
jgi:hypothetical protein